MTQGWRKPRQDARPASRGLKTNCDKRFDARRRRSSADARAAKIVPGRNALRTISGRKAGKFIPGRRAGEDHARTHGPLRGERSSVPVCFAGQSPLVAVSPSARPVPTSLGKQRRLRKSVVERFAALTREEREKKPVRWR